MKATPALKMPAPDSMHVLRKNDPLGGRFKVTARYTLRRMKDSVQCVRVHCFGGLHASLHVDLETFHMLFKPAKR